MLDLLIKGGTVADGSGAQARRCDVGVRAGRVSVICDPGTCEEPAAREIDADGLVVMPGFVDLHTHYDAQLFWDPTASPSPLHGVTTVIGGNCGFSLAPAGEEHAEYLTRMMARVEGMPLAALEKGLDWRWRSFGEWLDRLEDKVGVNAGFLVGHSALRRVVMGDAAVGSVATGAQRDAMVALAHEALEQGAFGLSTSQAHTHHDGAGDPVPSRHADRAELEALAAAVRDHSGTTLELIVPGCLNGFTDDEVDLMGTLSLLAGRPANWNVLGVSAMSPDRTEHQLAASDSIAERGGRLVALTLPHTMQLRLSFEHGAILEVPRYPWHRRLSWRVARKGGAWADTVEVAVSDFILERVGEHPHAASVRRIYNGIDPGRFISAREPAVHADEGECVVGFAGRLIHGKGPDYLIEAIALLRSTRLLRARIAGEGPERPRLEALARSLGVEDIVEFIGLTHDICGFWSASDVAVVPSAEFTEACPMTPLEAMACGKPIVATRNGGLPEIVLDGETGLLVTPGDAEALAMALARYADDSALRSSHGSRGRARVSERFHIAGCTRSYLALFSELAARPPAVAGLSPAAC